MELHLNLATRAYFNRRIIRRWLSLFCALLLLILGINLFFLLQNYQRLQKIDARHQEIDLQLVGLQGDEESYSPEKYAEIRAQVQAVNEIIIADQFFWTQLLGRFEELLPPDVAINSIQPDYKNRAFKVSAHAANVTAMTDFIERLLASEDFNQVYLFNQTETEIRDRAAQVVRFSLVIKEAF